MADLYLDLINDGNGSTVPSGPTTVTDSSATPIDASANSHYGFFNWTILDGSATIGDSSSASTTATLTSDATVQANFFYAAPVIDVQPTDQKVVVGNTLDLLVEAHGEGTLAYAWAQDGAPKGTDSSTYEKVGFVTGDRGIYNVTVTNADGTAISNDATVTVIPTITVPPVTQAFTIGSSASLSVTATGYGTLTYQWLKTGSPLVGETSDSLVLTPFTDSSRGTYNAVVYGDGNDVTSSGATLSVMPYITSQPASQAFTNGGTANLPVGVIGYGPTYQWFKAGSPISGATGNPLHLTPFADSSRGVYKVVVYDDGNDTTSNDATITERPAITVGPVSQVIVIGASASLSATATGYSLTYQWIKDNSPIPGATANPLVLTPFADSSSGVYKVVAYSDGLDTTSSDATLSSQITITSTPNKTAVEAAPYSYQPVVTGHETDNWGLTGAPADMAFSTTTGLIQWTPVDRTNSGNLHLSVYDTNGSSTTQDWTVAVINTAPVITSTPGTTANQNNPYSYSPTVVEAYVTYWALTGAPANMSFDSTSGTINWIPSFDQTSSGPLTLTVHDLGDKTDSQSFTVTVIPMDPIVKDFGNGPGQRKIILDANLSAIFGRPYGAMADYPYQP